MKKFAVLTLLLLLLNVAAAAPVEAGGPPEKGEYDGEVDFPVVDCHDYGYDFGVLGRSTYHTSWSYLERDDGYWKQEEHLTGVDLMYNASHPELSVSGDFTYNNHIERYIGPLCPTTWPCMIRNVTGVLWRIELPGANGSIEHGAGLKNDVRYWPAGAYTPPEQFVPEVFTGELKLVGLDKKDFVALCSALAP